MHPRWIDRSHTKGRDTTRQHRGKFVSLRQNIKNMEYGPGIVHIPTNTDRKHTGTTSKKVVESIGTTTNLLWEKHLEGSMWALTQRR